MQHKRWAIATLGAVAITVGAAGSGCSNRGTDCALNDLCENTKSPGSCKAWKAADANAMNGDYLIDPEDGMSPFQVYCDMTTAGGGWTLVFNHSYIDFVSSSRHTTEKTGYTADAITLAFWTVPITADIMLDASDGYIVEENQKIRSVIQGVPDSARNKTVHDLMNDKSPVLLDEDKSNVTNTFASGDCSSPPMWQGTNGYIDGICGPAVLKFSDSAVVDESCAREVFSLGAFTSATAATDCVGWPQRPNSYISGAGTPPLWPSSFRVWVR